jgi:hypothetical protein
MPFLVRGFYNNNDCMMLTRRTAKEAFAKAVEWHVVKGFRPVSISDGVKEYTIAEFASLMARRQIARTMKRE